MRIAVLVKQIPKFEEMELGPDGRLRRDGIEPEMNPYCRRAVSKAVELAAEREGSRVTVFTLGPPAADDTLREAIAWGLDRGVDITRRARDRRRVRGLRHPRHREGARRRAQHARRRAVRSRAHRSELRRRRHRPSRARSSPSCSTCRSSPACATSRSTGDARRRAVRARRRLAAGRGRAARGALVRRAAVRTRRRSTRPGRAAVPAERIRRLTAADLGPGPWGADASPTWVGPVKVMAVSRARVAHPGRAARRTGARRGARAPRARRAARRHPTTIAAKPCRPSAPTRAARRSP